MQIDIDDLYAFCVEKYGKGQADTILDHVEMILMVQDYVVRAQMPKNERLKNAIIELQKIAA